jgi:phosphate-selective porin
LCLNVHADTSIKVGGWSQHLSDGDYNSFHRLGMISHNNYFAAYFRNSFDDDSFALGRTWSTQDSVFTFNLHGGLTYGYRESSGCYKKQEDRQNDPKIVCPMVAPEVVAHRLPLKPSLALFGLDAVVLSFNVGL